MQYFPYGESWVEETKSQIYFPYKFTGKELDPETGLYYFGARYYEPRISVWISADAYIEKYIPLGSDGSNRPLPGIGGMYTPVNLDLYAYAHLNPVRWTDPDGNVVPLLVVGGGAALAWLYDAWQSPGVANAPESATAPTQAGPSAGETAGNLVTGASIGVGVGAAAAKEGIKEGLKQLGKEVVEELTGISPGKGKGKVPNPYGSKGKPDHQNKVEELFEKAKGEAKPGEKVVREKKVQGFDSGRKPDVQIVNEEGKTRKIFEAERRPGSSRNTTREAEYESLAIPNETHKVE